MMKRKLALIMAALMVVLTPTNTIFASESSTSVEESDGDISVDVEEGNESVQEIIQEEAAVTVQSTDTETVVDSGSCGDNITYTLTGSESDGYVLEFSGTGDMQDYYNATLVPWYSIREKIVSASISDGITSIGDYVFTGCSYLTSVDIPNSVTSIGYAAFLYCIRLATITIPDGVTAIDDMAFACCSNLSSITIPDGITEIGYMTFDECVSFKNITIPDGVTTIGDYAFSSCENLESVDIPDSVITIGEGAFSSCDALNNIEIPDSVTTLGASAFIGCDNMTSITLPSSITKIEDKLFYLCNSLVSVTILGDITSIGSYAFGSCVKLTDITIPDSVTTIDDHAFYQCYLLEDITLPDGLTEIGDYAFYQCYYIDDSDMNLSDSVESIGSYAFSYCYGLSNIVIPDSVLALRSAVFQNCTGLTTITIPESVSVIEANAFSGCTNLSNVTYKGSSSEWAVVNIADGNSCLTDASIQFEKVDLSSCTVTLSETEYTYDGTAKEPVVKVTDNGTELKEGIDYSVTYSKNTNAGTAQVTITGMGAYLGTLTETFTINKAGQSVTASADSASLTGVGTTTTITANTTGNGNITYSSSDTSVATVSSSGKVTAKGYGTTTITVKAAAASNYTEASTTISISVKLATPSGISVSRTTSGVKVSWSAVSGAVKYRVFRKTSDSSWTNVGDATSTSYTDTTAENGTKYYYTVCCINSDGTVYTSNYDTSGKSITYYKYAAPTLSSISNTTSGVKVSWGKVSGASKYRVYRKTSGGSWSKLADTTSTSYTDTTAKSGTTYYYTVCCLNSSGALVSSYDSSGLSIRYLTAGKISSLTNTSTGVTVKWSKVTGAKGYYVYRKTSSGSYKKIKTITSGSTVSYTDTAVKNKNGTKYTYAVKPYYGDTVGSYTGKSTYRLTTPTISSAKNSSSKKVTVKWSKVSSVTGYQIQYSTSSSFSSYKTVSVSGASKVSKTISSLKKGKKYYVRIRTYKTVSGTKYYSGWSSKKSVKISK